MKKEITEEINKLLHRIARVIGDIDKEKKDFEDNLSQNIRDLLICRSEILKLVEILNEENGRK